MSAAIPIETYSERAGTDSLANLARGERARIVDVVERGANVPQETLDRLRDLGFVPGEIVRVLARGPLGGEPLAIRVGTSTFALRRYEADCILIAPLNRV